MTEKVGYWGYWLGLNGSGCDVAKITDKANIQAFTKELVDRINMKAYGPTWAEHFAQHDPTKSGYSMFQMIETSNICAHFVDATGEIYLDVFSCAPYDVETVIATVSEFFGMSNFNFDFIERKAPVNNGSSYGTTDS